MICPLKCTFVKLNTPLPLKVLFIYFVLYVIEYFFSNFVFSGGSCTANLGMASCGTPLSNIVISCSGFSVSCGSSGTFTQRIFKRSQAGDALIPVETSALSGAVTSMLPPFYLFIYFFSLLLLISSFFQCLSKPPPM